MRGSLVSSKCRFASELTIGQRIRSARLRKGWNQLDLAAKAGVSRTTLYQLERGAIPSPRAATLHRLASALEIPDSWLNSAELPDEFQPPRVSSLSETTREFDRQTNPYVDVVQAQFPEVFTGFTDADWDELYSTFGAGGALTEDGVLQAARLIASKRETLRRVSLLLETHLAEPTKAMVDSLFALIELK
jgi:transcriptional regulator with XRE-family HTH domain